MTDHEIRPARDTDAEAISDVIKATLRETNAKDYSAEIIARLERSFSVETVRGFIADRRVFVAVSAGRLVGTAGLDGGAVRTVFVAPDMQGKGVGGRLMGAVEDAARAAGLKVLRVPSSLTAEGFYARLGYRRVREAHYGDERTVVMERRLAR